MSLEIERKFLVKGEAWRGLVQGCCAFGDFAGGEKRCGGKRVHA